ncbi:MAG: putative motility protein [Clostridiaceae bacterium]|nr:putative motility protein [Clostridiaceae bacterium]
MDIAALSVVYHQNAVKQHAGIAVLKKAMENMEANNEALLRMMEQSVNPHVGSNVDIKV